MRRSPLSAAALAALVLVVPLAAAAPAVAPGALAGSGVIPSTVVKKLAAPTSPANDDPAALAALDAPNSPDDDLLAALTALAGAPDADAATAARSRALDILEGNPIAGRVYSGIPLLDWNLPARVKTVPAGGQVTVTEIRFADRTISDTARLVFDDPSQPYRIAYRIAELGGRFGGTFAPAVLHPNGSGESMEPQGLALPNQPTGTSETNRFHPSGAPEVTRLGLQELVVPMPAPAATTAVVDPDTRAGVNAVATVTPATADQVAALQATYGFSGNAPTDAEKAAAIAKLAPNAPAKLLWTALHDLDPADPAFLAAAHSAGAQNAALVDALRTHNALPAGLPTAPAAVSVAIAGGEAYASETSVRAAGTISVSVANSDTFARSVAIRVLRDRRANVNPDAWGSFAWTDGGNATLAPGERRTLTVGAGANAFALWIGDPDGGDQAATLVHLNSGPATSSVRMANNRSMPSHIAEDAAGQLWVALVGTDTIARIQPAVDASKSTVTEFPLPGGVTNPNAAGNPLAPHDLAIDSHGIIWVTLGLGNAIARLDPAAMHGGTSDGMRVYPLDACTQPAPMCGLTIPAPPVPTPPTRLPNQMKLLTAANGDTILWFTESYADAIGEMRVAADGSPVATAHFPCQCGEPEGIGLAADGSVWYTIIVGNALVRLRPDAAQPFATKLATIDQFSIPSSVTVVDAAHPEPGIETAGAHSLAIDQTGRLWFTEEETAKIGFLDPNAAQPGTGNGITEFPLGTTAFGVPVQPADLSVAGDGTVFWADEYGDVVGSATAAGTIRKWLPAERASNTDSPIIDSHGNLWFSESAAALVTRIGGVGAPTSPPSTPVPTITADLAAGTVSGAGLPATALVDVEVRRDGAVTQQVPNNGVTDATFTAATPGLAPGDVVRVVRHSARPFPTLEFPVADIAATIAPDGLVRGHALTGGKPVPDGVTVNAGGTPTTVTVDADGSFMTRVPAGTAGGSVLTAGSTVAGVFQTIALLLPPSAAMPNVPTRSPAGDASAPDPTAPRVVAPQGGSGAPPSALDRACDGKLWLVDRTVPLLGLTTAQVTDCLGTPTRVATRRDGTRWYYGHAIDLRIRRDVVVSLGLHDKTFRSDVADVGVGTALWKVSQALRGLRYDGLTQRFRIALAQGDGQVADIFIPPGHGRRPRVESITINLVGKRNLDRFGRSLLRRSARL